MLNHRHIHAIISITLVLFIQVNQARAFQALQTKPIYHEVGDGETLYSLSSRYQTSVEQLKSFNNITGNIITKGNQLIVGHQTIKSADVKNKEEQSLFSEIAMQVDQIAANASRNTKVNASVAPIESIDMLFNSNVIEGGLFNQTNQLNLEKIKGLNNDLGLRLIGGYTRNFAPDILNSEESFFNSWVSGGANLELLNGGLLGNKIKAEEIRKEIGINELNQAKSVKKENYTYLYNYLLYSFNKAKYAQLENRAELIIDFLEISSKLYYLRGISWEEVIQWKSELQQINGALKNIKGYNQVFMDNYGDLNFGGEIEAEQLPLLEINLDELIKDAATDSVDQRLINLHRERLALKYRKNSDLSLQAQFKVNALTGQSNGRSRAYGSFRLSLSAPLFKNKRSQQLQEKEIAVVQQRLVEESSSINNEIMNLYYEYQYTLKDFISFTGKKEQLQERIRKGYDLQVMNENSHSSISTLSMLREMYTIDFDLLDIKQKLYLQLLKIYTLSDVSSVAKFTNPTNIQTSFNKTNDDRAVYLWSNTYNELGQSFLLRYLGNNDINRVMFSPGLTTTDTNQFLKEGIAQNKIIYRLIGENSYVKKGFTESLKQKIKDLDPLFHGIHLDVEPQALKDWNTHQEIYLNNFIDVLQGSKMTLPEDKALSVSIPVFFPTNTLKQAFTIANEVVVMVYGNTDIGFIKRKLSEELMVPGAAEKLTVALRASDFNDRIEMEELIDEVIIELGINRFMIQDLGDLISLDQKTILGDIKSNK